MNAVGSCNNLTHSYLPWNGSKSRNRGSLFSKTNKSGRKDRENPLGPTVISNIFGYYDFITLRMRGDNKILEAGSLLQWKMTTEQHVEGEGQLVQRSTRSTPHKNNNARRHEIKTHNKPTSINSDTEHHVTEARQVADEGSTSVRSFVRCTQYQPVNCPPSNQAPTPRPP